MSYIMNTMMSRLAMYALAWLFLFFLLGEVVVIDGMFDTRLTKKRCLTHGEIWWAFWCALPCFFLGGGRPWLIFQKGMACCLVLN